MNLSHHLGVWTAHLAWLCLCITPLQLLGQTPEMTISSKAQNLTQQAAVAAVPRSTALAPADVPELRLTGLAFIQSKKWAFFVRQDPSVAPQFAHMHEGQSQRGLDLIEVDLDKRSARFRFAGQEIRLSLITRGPELISDVETEGSRFIQAHQRFVDEHTHAHELRQEQERQREQQERQGTSTK